MSDSIIKTIQEKKELISNVQNSDNFKFNKYSIKTGILHEKLNVSKPAVISYDDFMDLFVPFSQNNKTSKDTFDKEISDFVQECEQNRNNNKCDLKRTQSSVNNVVKLSGITESNASRNNVNDNEVKLENEMKSKNTDSPEINKHKGMDEKSHVEVCQEEPFENVSCDIKNNISIFCKRIYKNKYKCNNQQNINLKISVIDYVNDLKREFCCSKSLFIEKMGIFFEINNKKIYSIENVLIHCDINIFGWLVHWMKESTEHTKPVISYFNVIPILNAANFFKINPLIEQCILFIRLYINNVIEATPDFSKVNSQLITKLTEHFSNTEVEDIVDREDKLLSVIYCNLILFLANEEPKRSIKHFSSLADIFCCKLCNKLLPKDKYSTILCKSDCNIINLNGSVEGLHVRDKTWNVTSHVKATYVKLQNWRSVYWQLWGSCHFLFCSICKMLYPLYQTSWCSYHPGEIEYFTLDDEGKSMTLPIGRYNCCGQRVYKYECMKNPNCCAHRTHIPILESASEIEINHLFLKHQDIILLKPPKLNFPESLTQLIRSHNNENITTATGTNNFWWYGIQLTPRSFKHPGPLIPRFWDETSILKYDKNKIEKAEIKSLCYINNVLTHVSFNEVITAQIFIDDSINKVKERTNNHKTNFSYSSLKVPDESILNIHKKKISSSSIKKKKKHKKEPDEIVLYSPHSLIPWNVGETIRLNQDNQRDYEDWAFSKIILHLTSINNIPETRASILRPAGGSYYRIESEWQEKNKRLFCKRFDKKVTNLKRGFSFALGSKFW